MTWFELFLQGMTQIDTAQTVGLGVVLAVAFELVTCWGRFGLKLQSTRDTAFLSRFTWGWRIHHGYLGVGMLAAMPLVGSAAVDALLLAVGLGLVLSDLVHHFAVLWPITGRAEFDLRYPGRAGVMVESIEGPSTSH